MTKQYYTPMEIAAILGVADSTARGLIVTNMPHIRMGRGRILVEIKDFEAWQESAKTVPDGNGAPRMRPWPEDKPKTDAEKLREWHKNRRAAQAAQAAKGERI